MTRASLIAHLSFPVLFTLVGVALALQREPVGAGMLSAHLLGAGLFYSAPHLVWAFVCAALKPWRLIWHAGFVVSSGALLFIGCASFVFHDSSGLPYQWLVYWPLAGLLLAVVLAVWLVAGRPRAGD